MEIGQKYFFKSSIIQKISSESLSEIKKNYYSTLEKRKELKKELAELHKAVMQKEKQRRKIDWFPMSMFFKTKLNLVNGEIEDIHVKEAIKLEEISLCKLKIDIELDKQTESAFAILSDEFEKMAMSEVVWDVTTSEVIDRISLRTTAEQIIERKVINLKIDEIEIVACDYKGLHFENKNGGDLYVYPYFIIVRDKNDFAFIELNSMNVEAYETHFIEQEKVPKDTKILSYTWAKVNKDGSRDKRFAGNYQIPIVNYLTIYLTTEQGLNEAYMISNKENGVLFINALKDYQKILNKKHI